MLPRRGQGRVYPAPGDRSASRRLTAPQLARGRPTGAHGSNLGTSAEGQDGQPSTAVAAGGPASGAPCGAGGAGGAGSTPPVTGGVGILNNGGGGGGGGAVGRVRFNWYQHASAPPVPVSGKVSTGEALVQ